MLPWAGTEPGTLRAMAGDRGVCCPASNGLQRHGKEKEKLKARGKKKKDKKKKED